MLWPSGLPWLWVRFPNELPVYSESNNGIMKAPILSRKSSEWIKIRFALCRIFYVRVTYTKQLLNVHQTAYKYWAFF
jgi:hypothetical protein